MSDFDRIPALLAEIGADCPAAPKRRPWAELRFHPIRRPDVLIYCACPDEFQEQNSRTLDVGHIDGDRGKWASITVTAGPAEDPIALLERALDFVRTETPVPL